MKEIGKIAQEALSKLQESTQELNKKKLKCSCGVERDRLPSDYINQETYVCDECLVAINKKYDGKIKEDLKIFNLHNSMIPDMFLKYAKSFHFNTKKLLKGIYCYGDTGTAKTTYLCCLGKELCAQGTVLFIPTVNLLLKAQGVFKAENKTIEQEFEPYLSVDYLILDDIGVEKVTDFVKQSLYYLINERYIYEKPTFFTSNLDLDKLAAKFDNRIASRIAGMCDIVHFKGKDKRIKYEN